MTSLNEHLYGKEFSDALDAFHDGLDKIEAKYLRWFESRPGKTDKVSFGKTSDLPQEIKDECLEAFKKRFEPLQKFQTPGSI